MSAPSDISSTGAEAKVLNEIELAVRAGAARALRARAALQRKKAGDGTAAAGEQFPDVTIQTGEAAVAGRLASAFELLADEIEFGGDAMTLPPLLALGEAPAMGAILVRNFDYDTLAPDIASMAAAAATEIRTSTRRQITEVIAAGKLLLEVKVALPHGSFGKWLEAEFGWTERTAQNYMRAAETYGSNPQRVADLPLKTIYQLQAPTVPESVRVNIFSMAERGERPTQVAVEALISDAKRKRDEERREAKEQEERDRRSLRSSKKYKERMAAEREAAKAEAEKRAVEEKEAAQQAAELIGKALPPPHVQALIALIETSRMWLFLDALKQLGKVGDVCDDQRFAAERIVGGGQ